MEKKKIQNGKVSVKDEDPIMTFNSKKFKDKCVGIIEFCLDKLKLGFKIVKSFFIKLNSNIDYDEKKVIEIGKMNFKKFFNFILNLIKLIISKVWKIFKIILLIVILLLIGAMGGLYYGVQNPDTIDNWIRIGVEIGNSQNNEMNFKSFSYEGFGSVYLNENISSYREVSDGFKSGKISYKYSSTNPIGFSYTSDWDCSKNNLSNFVLETCKSQSFVINKYFNKVWVFEEERNWEIYDDGLGKFEEYEFENNKNQFFEKYNSRIRIISNNFNFDLFGDYYYEYVDMYGDLEKFYDDKYKSDDFEDKFDIYFKKRMDIMIFEINKLNNYTGEK